VDLKKFGSNTTAKILSVLFAVILWFHIATNAEYNYKVTIPIKFIEPSSGYMLASIPPRDVQVYVRGTGKKLLFFNLKNFIDPEGSYISPNFAGLPKGRHRINLNKEDIYLAVERGIDVENILTNSFFYVIIDKKKKETVPVDITSLPDFKLEDNHVLSGKLKVYPEFVIIEGPEDIVNSIRSAKISSLDKKIISHKDSLVHAQFESIPFVTFNPDEVYIMFPVEPLRTKLFRSIPITFRNVPIELRQRIAPDTLSVYIHGPESIVSKSRSEDIVVIVSYRNYRDKIAQGDSLLTPELIYPEGLTSANTVPGFLRIAGHAPGS